MKPRKPLNRYTRLAPGKPLAKRSKRRAQAVKENAASLGEYASSHVRCALCGISAFKAYGPDRMLDLHHIAGRGLRHDVPENWLMLCRRDHDQFHFGGRFDDEGNHLPEVTPGMILTAKRDADGECDEALIASLKGWQALPEKWVPCPLPAVYLLERERNGL